MKTARWPLLVVTLIAAEGVSAQSITGRALDLVTEGPVVAAQIELIDRRGDVRARSVTDSAGWFRLAAPQPGTYAVRATSIGYANAQTDTVGLDPGEELEVELRLGSQPVPLAPLRVIAQRTIRIGRLAQYYDRAEWSRKSGLGRVYTRDEVSSMRLSRVSSLLDQYPVRSTCRMTYMLDNLPMSRDDIDRSIMIDDVEGVEVYRAQHQVPAEYAHRTTCGLVLVWTRADHTGPPFSWKRALVFLTVIGGAVLLTNR
jgi:hypothetical protein